MRTFQAPLSDTTALNPDAYPTIQQPQSLFSILGSRPLGPLTDLCVVWMRALGSEVVFFFLSWSCQIDKKVKLGTDGWMDK